MHWCARGRALGSREAKSAYDAAQQLLFIGCFSQGVIESADPWYGLRAFASLATLCILAFAGSRRLFQVGPVALLVTVAAAVAAPILFAIDEAGAFGVIVAVLGGVSSAVLMYVWMRLLSSCPVRVIVGAGIAGLLVLGAIIMGVPRLDAALGLMVAVAFAVTYVAYHRAFGPVGFWGSHAANTGSKEVGANGLEPVSGERAAANADSDAYQGAWRPKSPWRPTARWLTAVPSRLKMQPRSKALSRVMLPSQTALPLQVELPSRAKMQAKILPISPSCQWTR